MGRADGALDRFLFKPEYPRSPGSRPDGTNARFVIPSLGIGPVLGPGPGAALGRVTGPEGRDGTNERIVPGSEFVT